MKIGIPIVKVVPSCFRQYLVLLIKLIIQLGHRKEIRELTFHALDIRLSDEGLAP